jgi:hypothetical protein
MRAKMSFELVSAPLRFGVPLIPAPVHQSLLIYLLGRLSEPSKSLLMMKAVEYRSDGFESR